MPIAIPTPETVSRRSGEDPIGGPTNSPAATLVASSARGYEFPELEGKEPQQQVGTNIKHFTLRN